MISCIALWGCSKAQPHVTIIDEAKFFQTQVPSSNAQKHPGPKAKKSVPPTPMPPIMTLAQVEKQLHEIADTKGIDLVLHTVPAYTFSEIELPTYLDETFENEPAWRSISGSNWFSKLIRILHLRPWAPADSAEFIVLAKPDFVAVRFGASARLHALSAGLMSSPELFSIQQRATTNPVSGLKELLGFVQDHYPEPAQESWRERITRWLLYADLNNIITSVTLNHWKFYNKYLLAPTLYLQAQAARYLPIWCAPIAGILVIVITAGAIKSMVRLGVKKKGFFGFVCLAVIVALELLTVVPSIGSLFMISHQRLEDHIFVQSLLSQELVNASPLFNGPVANFAGHTGFWWVLGFTLVVPLWLLSEGFWCVPLSELPADRQRTIYENFSAAQQFMVEGAAKGYSQEVRFDEGSPFSSVGEAMMEAVILRPIKYFFLYLYLPFPISVVLCNRMLTKILLGLRSNWKHYKQYKTIAEQNVSLQRSNKAVGE